MSEPTEREKSVAEAFMAADTDDPLWDTVREFIAMHDAIRAFDARQAEPAPAPADDARYRDGIVRGLERARHHAETCEFTDDVVYRINKDLARIRSGGAIEPGGAPPTLHRCHAGKDGECNWGPCPQARDGEPKKSGRHCPIDVEVLLGLDREDNHPGVPMPPPDPGATPAADNAAGRLPKGWLENRCVAGTLNYAMNQKLDNGHCALRPDRVIAMARMSLAALKLREELIKAEHYAAVGHHGFALLVLRNALASVEADDDQA